jgi:hypothetical protein
LVHNYQLRRLFGSGENHMVRPMLNLRLAIPSDSAFDYRSLEIQVGVAVCINLTCWAYPDFSEPVSTRFICTNVRYVWNLRIVVLMARADFLHGVCTGVSAQCNTNWSYTHQWFVNQVSDRQNWWSPVIIVGNRIVLHEQRSDSP